MNDTTKNLFSAAAEYRTKANTAGREGDAALALTYTGVAERLQAMAVAACGAPAAARQAGAVAEALFIRNTHLWTPADERIGKPRSGSPKTLAINALPAELSA